jgi:hypothetical protein
VWGGSSHPTRSLDAVTTSSYKETKNKKALLISRMLHKDVGLIVSRLSQPEVDFRMNDFLESDRYRRFGPLLESTATMV